jgi:PKD repeat protein/outer membrane protein assembly factor BamB
MQRIYTFIFAAILISSVAYSWEQALDHEFISVNKRIKNIALNNANDVLYCLDIDHHITKYDAHSGKILWEKEISAEAADSTSLCGSFLSEDGLSYILIYNYLDSMSFKGRIYDIESDELINECHFALDSFDGELHNTGVNSFQFLKADYISSKKLLLINESMDASRGGPDGLYSIYANGDYGMIKAVEFNGNNDYTVYTAYDPIMKYDLTNNKNGIFFHVIDSTYLYYESIKSQVNSYVIISKTQEFRYWNLDSSKSTLINYQMDFEDEIKYSFHGDKLCILENDNHWLVYDLNLDTVIYHAIVAGLEDIKAMFPIDNDLSALMFDDKVDIYSVDNGTLIYSYPAYNEALYDLKPENGAKRMYCLSETNKIIRFENYFLSDRIKALFTSSTQNAMVGDEIIFKDLSTGEPDAYLWDFGDGKSSTEKDPKHVYQTDGYFNVSLKVTNGSDSDTRIMDSLIYIIPKLEADFDYDIIGEYNPKQIRFNNTSAGSIDSIKWFVNNEYVSDQDDFLHTFFYRGDYNIKLLVFSYIFRDSLSLDLNITDNLKKTQDIDSNIVNEFIFIDDQYPNYYFSFSEGFETEWGDFCYSLNKWKLIVLNADLEIKNRMSFTDMFIKLLKNDRGDLFCIEYLNKHFIYPPLVLRSNLITEDGLMVTDSIKRFSILHLSDIEFHNDELQALLNFNSSSYFRIFRPYRDSIQVIKDVCQYSLPDHNSYSVNKERFQLATTSLSSHCFCFMDVTTTREWGHNIYKRRDTLFCTTMECPMEYPMTEMVSNNSEIFTCGENGIVYAFDNEGDSLWSVRLNGKLNHCLITGDALIISGSIQDQCGYYVLDLDGKLIDSLIIQGRIGEFKHCSECPDGAFLFSGSRSDTLGSYYCYSSKIKVFNRESIINQPDTNDIPIITNNDMISFHQISGNPSIGESTIEFTLREESQIQIEIFNNVGEIVKQIANSAFEAGKHKVDFSTEDMIGIFYYRISAKGDVKYGKFMVMN